MVFVYLCSMLNAAYEFLLLTGRRVDRSLHLSHAGSVSQMLPRLCRRVWWRVTHLHSNGSEALQTHPSNTYAYLSGRLYPTALDNLVKGFAMAHQESIRLPESTAEEVASLPSSFGSVPL